MNLQESNTPPANAKNSSDAEAVFQRAEANFQAKRFDAARTLYRQLHDAGVTPGLMLYRLAMIANAQQDFGGAWDLHHQALEVDAALASRIVAKSRPHHQLICRTRYDTEAVPHCPVCGSGEQAAMMVVNCLAMAAYQPAFSPVRRWVQCGTCGHGFINPRPSPAAVQEAFREPAPEHLLNLDFHHLTCMGDIIHQLWQHKPGGDFLDVGVANGALSLVAQDYGYRACGLDIHSGYEKSVRGMGVEFLLADIATYDFGDRRFDVIAMGDVIEHVAYPRTVLAGAVAILKPGGLLWLSTPNFEGPWTRLLWHNDPMWLESEHLQYFSQRSLRRLVADLSLEVVDYRMSKRYKGSCETTLVKPG